MTGTQPEITRTDTHRHALPSTETLQHDFLTASERILATTMIDLIKHFPPSYEGAREFCQFTTKHPQETVRCALAESPLLQASPETAELLAHDSQITVGIMLAKSAHIASYPHALSILIEDFKTAKLREKEQAEIICWAMAGNTALSELPEIVRKLRELNDLKINTMLDQNHALAPRTEPQPAASL